MEAARPSKHKCSKVKKKRHVGNTHVDENISQFESPNEHAPNKNKCGNVADESIVDNTAADGEEAFAGPSFSVELPVQITSPVSIKELEILNNLDISICKEEEQQALNNLDIASPLSDALTKSKLNVFETSEVTDAENETVVLSPEEEEEEEDVNSQVEQLYPSLNEVYYQDLEVKSSALNRSVSKIVCPGEEIDVLSMQSAEAQLDTMAAYMSEEDGVLYPALSSFEVVNIVNGEAYIDEKSFISQDTVHHLSLHAVAEREKTEGVFRDCYHSECATPTQSMTNFEELNKEIMIDELRNFYCNPQLQENDTFLCDFLSICQNTNHEFYHLLARYKESRDAYLEHVDELQDQASQCTKDMDSIWTFTKEKKTETAYCSDFMKVTLTETCSRCHCHQDVVNNVSNVLRSTREIAGYPLVLKQYNWKVSYYHVEQYVVKVVQDCLAYFTITDSVTSYFPDTQHLAKTSELRLCIAILFYFKRQKETDDVFADGIKKWLQTLIGLQLRVGTLLDHRFILNHLIRCPTGFSFWGSSFLQFVWGEVPYSTETCIGNPLVDHFLLMYYTLITPVAQRDTLLANYEPPPQDSDPSEWALLDELGEVSCDNTQLLERDYLALLGQFNFGMLFRELLLQSTPEEFMKNRNKLTEQIVMNVLSICLKTINYIKEAFTHLDFTRYRNFCQRNAKVLTTFIRFTSDYCYFYDGYGGKYERWANTVDTSYCKLITLHDIVFQEGFRCLAETSSVSLWQFLTDLPYYRIVIKILWKLYGFLHQVNPEKHIKSSILNNGSAYDIVTKLYKTSRFQKRLETLSDEDCTFMVNVFCKMALSRDAQDENFIKVIALDIYHIGATATEDKQSTDRACRCCLSNIVDHYPSVVSVILNNIEQPTLKDLPSNLRVFRGISLQSWLPTSADFLLLTSWLKTTPITSLTNQISRTIIKGLNWGSHKGRLFIPADIHRKMAAVIVEAHAYHLPDRPGYFIHASTPDYSKHVSNSDKNNFVHWCWEVLFMLCLHKADLYEHDSVTMKFMRQQSRQLKKQKSETSAIPSTGEQERVLVKQPTVIGMSTPEVTPSEGLDSFVGKWGKFPFKMRKENNLVPVCEALRTNGEMAAFVALCTTTIGHTIVDFQADGIQLLQLLHKTSQNRAVLSVLSNLLPITLKSNCVSLLLQLPEFLPCVVAVARADYNNVLSARATKPFTGYIVSMITSAYSTSLEQGNLAMKMFVQLFFSTPNFHSEASIIYILDKIFKVVFRYQGDEEYIMEQLRVHFLKIMELAKRNSSKIMSIMSWFSASSCVSSLIQNLNNPGEVFWWSYYVTKMECYPQHATKFFPTLIEVLVANPDYAIDAAVRRTHELVVAGEVSSIQVPDVAIYKWGSLLQQVPMDHPLLPYAWKEFFMLYFSRVTPEMGGVGYRFYQGMFQVKEIKSIKQRLADTAKSFELGEDQEGLITETMIFQSKVSHFLNSLSLWVDETRLHEANLYIAGLPPQYNGQILGKLMEGDTDQWREYVNISQIDMEISADSNEWMKCNSRKYTPRTSKRPEETAEYLVDKLFNYVRTNISKAEPPPEVLIPSSHIPPVPDLQLQDTSSLITTVGPYLSKLRIAADKYNDLISMLSNLDFEYIDTVPDMYSNRTVQKTEMVPCYSRMVTLGKCTGPALIAMTTTQYIENTAVIESINDNRTKYENVLAQLKVELEDDICLTTMFVETIVSSLYWRSDALQELGRKLFYHVIDSLSDEVWSYPPSQQIFAFSIDCLGQFFIRNNPNEALPLLHKILSLPKFATILAPIFHPNQGYDKFICIYEQVTSSLNYCEMDVAFMILSKFDIRGWLSTTYSTVENCKVIIDSIFNGFAVYPVNEDNKNYMMFYDVLKLHLRIILGNRICGVLHYVVSKTLVLSSKSAHHQSVWREIIGVLESDHCFQALTLNACHKVLFDISKYFLQFKKSILKSSLHDLYSHWSAYTECILELYTTLCTLYINAAIVNPDLEYKRSKTGDSEVDCIMTMVCAVFGPWILVFEEACLPWTDAAEPMADRFLGGFCDMIALIDTTSGKGVPVLHKFWWYYLEMLGHTITPKHVIQQYYCHVILLPWQSFVLSLDVLHSMLKCVRQNRSNINLVIYIMTQVNWQTVVEELEKQSHAFDMLIDVLITFALSPDIFQKFTNEFVVLFRKFKALDLSLCSDDGFKSILSRIDKTVHMKQHVQSNDNTSHLIQFMGTLCRFKYHDGSYNKQLTYFKHVVNIINKMSNVELAEAVLQGLFYHVEQVFYVSKSSYHVIQLCAELLNIFNKNNTAEPQIQTSAVKKIEGAIRDKGSVKEGFSFSQLSLYYMSAATETMHNIRYLSLVTEVLIESYFAHCQNTHAVLSVAWSSINDCFNLSQMSNESFVNHSINERCVLNLYLYTHNLLDGTVGIDEQYSVVAMLADSAFRVVPTPRDEQKLLLLWYKTFDIILKLHNLGIRSSALTSIIKPLPGAMQKLAEGREGTGLFGTTWFSKKSKLSLEFRLVARILSTFILHQLNKDGSLRLVPGYRHNISSDSSKSLESLRNLINNKSYAAHITIIQKAIATVLDVNKTMIHIIELIRHLTVTYFDSYIFLSDVKYAKS